MKSFVIQLLIFVSPLVIGAIAMEVILRSIPNDYSYKYKFLTEQGKEIETMILGSSHAVYGIHPDTFSAPAFNAAHVSQTLRYDHVILSQVIESLPSLETIVIPISYFSFRTSLDQSKESWRIKNYHLYYDCEECDKAWTHRMEILNGTFSANLRRVWNWLRSNQDEVSSTRLGYGTKHLNKPSKDLQTTAIIAAERHTHESDELVEQNQVYLSQIIELARKYNVKVVLLTMPGSSYYRDKLEKEQLEEMQSICQEWAAFDDVIYLDLLDSDLFTEQDFRDGDHLNLQGAVKLSQYLEPVISQELPSR